MNTVTKILPHINIVLAGLLITLAVVDYFNGSMGFLDNDVARIIMVLLGITSILTAAVLVACQRRAAQTDG